jgi:hypothetical protein
MKWNVRFTARSVQARPAPAWPIFGMAVQRRDNGGKAAQDHRAERLCQKHCHKLTNQVRTEKTQKAAAVGVDFPNGEDFRFLPSCSLKR